MLVVLPMSRSTPLHCDFHSVAFAYHSAVVTRLGDRAHLLVSLNEFLCPDAEQHARSWMWEDLRLPVESAKTAQD
jgi:hypothetical protein